MRRHYTFGVSLVSTVGAGFSSSSRGAIFGDAPVGMQPLSKEAAGTLKQGVVASTVTRTKHVWTQTKPLLQGRPGGGYRQQQVDGHTVP